MGLLQSRSWLSLVTWGMLACAGPQKAGQSGAVCFRDDDCALGLVCVAPEAGGDRVCSADVGGIISTVDAGVATGGAATAGAAGSTAGVAAMGGAAAAMGGAAAAMGGATATAGVGGG